MTSDTHALGLPEEQTATYDYYSDNLLKSMTDALSRVTSFDYDGVGNTTRITRLDGTPVTTTMAYAGPFGQLTSVTDPLNHTSTFDYDQNGNLSTVSDPLQHETHFSYNSDGQVATVSDDLSNTMQFGYFGGDLASVTDPLGNTTLQFTDSWAACLPQWTFRATPSAGHTLDPLLRLMMLRETSPPSPMIRTGTCSLSPMPISTQPTGLTTIWIVCRRAPILCCGTGKASATICWAIWQAAQTGKAR